MDFLVFEAPKLPPRDAEETTRQADLTRKMFRVVEYLKSVGADKPVTLEKIEGALGIRIREDAKLDEELRRNVRIKYFQGAFSYKVCLPGPCLLDFCCGLDVWRLRRNSLHPPNSKAPT